jgi:hypothetical protein
MDMSIICEVYLMIPMRRLGPEDEAEIRVMIEGIYKSDGIYAVLECVSTLQKVIIAIMQKANELLEEEKTQ